MKIVLNENEKNQISSQHEEIDSRLFNFLMRRIEINKRKLGGNWGDFEPLEVTEYSFEGLPGYGFTSYYSKKNIENTIIKMLWENDIVGDYTFDLKPNDPERIKVVKTVRKFLNFILTK